MDWQSENSYLENDLASVAKRGAITKLNIIESEEGYYVTIEVPWNPEPLFLSNRRQRDKPRYFHNMDRLVTKLRELDITGAQIALKITDSPPRKRPINRIYTRKSEIDQENQ
jgi:hypothetical protein